MVALHSGEGFIKITGEVGTGKTMLCRKLLNELEEGFRTAYIPNPHLSQPELLATLAAELRMPELTAGPSTPLLSRINLHLLDLAAQGKPLVLVLDEAQAIPPESLELLRLLTNLETESRKLMQIVLFGQPELDELLSRPEFRQLRQRITFSYRLTQLNARETRRYLFNRLRVAGYTRRDLFSECGYRMIHWLSRGTPRLLNILAHKALLVAYGKGARKVLSRHVLSAARDTEGLEGMRLMRTGAWLLALLAVLGAGWMMGRWPGVRFP
jgi:MSHA biogenesis protein MshM